MSARTTRGRKRRAFLMDHEEEDEDEDGDFVCMDPLGDLLLLVGQERTGFKVCSRTVSRASPVLAAMLAEQRNGVKQEPGTKWVVALPDDDPTAFRVFLDVAHARQAEVPAELTSDELFAVAMVVDKYRALEILKPWSPGWFQACKADAGEPGHEALLSAAWILGSRSIVEAAMRGMVLQLEILDTSNGTISLRGVEFTDQPWFTHLQSTELLDHIKNSHQVARQKILDALNDWYTLILNSEPVSRGQRLRRASTGRFSDICYCTYKTESIAACETLQTGSFIQGLLRNGLFPIPTAREITTSLAQLEEQFNDIVLGMRFYDHSAEDKYNHAKSCYGNHSCAAKTEFSRCTSNFPLLKARTELRNSFPNPTISNEGLSYLQRRVHLSGFGQCRAVGEGEVAI